MQAKDCFMHKNIIKKSFCQVFFNPELNFQGEYDDYNQKTTTA
jgi:hypothetical protein